MLKTEAEQLAPLLDPRIAAAEEIERAARAEKQRIIAEVQAQCPHPRVIDFRGGYAGGWLHMRVCPSCGAHHDPQGCGFWAGTPLYKENATLDVIKIEEPETLWKIRRGDPLQKASKAT